MWFRLLKWVLLGPVVRWYTRPRVTGREHLPRTGPVVLAANHRAEIDSLVLCLVLPRQPRFVAKAEYFAGHGLRGRVERWLCTVTGQIPVDRRGGDAAGACAAGSRGRAARGRDVGDLPRGGPARPTAGSTAGTPAWSASPARCPARWCCPSVSAAPSRWAGGAVGGSGSWWARRSTYGRGRCGRPPTA
ncbi:lysophospholipid acyltransferase family protein [Nocardioides convexus]|uniref:lysophospholipid acyltransferase family protein n=1 Tax=Nocardioides convexus TaxID=2712224 RepID=UPI00241832A0|nr:lysophospholipid acyltransferase family protein [Nocardioides convexus]